jgi:hypothetical protein
MFGKAKAEIHSSFRHRNSLSQLFPEVANLEALNNNIFVIEHGGDHVATRFCLLRREGQR